MRLLLVPAAQQSTTRKPRKTVDCKWLKGFVRNCGWRQPKKAGVDDRETTQHGLAATNGTFELCMTAN
jgi:hypothetical protein